MKKKLLSDVDVAAVTTDHICTQADSMVVALLLATGPLVYLININIMYLGYASLHLCSFRRARQKYEKDTLCKKRKVGHGADVHISMYQIEI